MIRIERALMALMAPPANVAPDSARNDMTAVALAIAVLLVIAALCSVIPGARS